MTPSARITVRFAALAMSAFAIASMAAAPRSPAPPAARPATVAESSTLTLARIVETRAADLTARDEDDAMMMMSSQQPSLQLVFTLKMPRGDRLMGVEQPTKITAADSAGTNLAKIEPGFSGDLEYLDVEHDFKEDDDLSEITLQLAPSVRKAETFDVAAEFIATVYTGSTPVKLDLTAEWLPLPGDLSELKGKARIKATDEGVAIEPAAIEKWLEKLEVQIGPNQVVDSNGWFSDGTTITYMFDDLPKERPLKAVLTLRTGVKTVPLKIEVNKQPLP